ncbi:MAG: cytochrome d ubiquinol oxidase subunit II [Chloroflexota bacterium]
MIGTGMMGTIWYWLVAAMLVAYVVLDGFDIGAGIIHLFIAKSDQDRQMILRSIGHVWDGNVWREFFDGCFAISSALLAIFLGAALANVIRGVPIGDDSYFFLPLWTNWQVGPNPGILDWYTVIGGFVALVALTVHGCLFVALKVDGELHDRAVRLARALWPVLVAMTIVSLVSTVVVRPSMLENYARYPVAMAIPVLVMASLLGIPVSCRSGRLRAAFRCSCTYLIFMLVGAAAGLYPTLLPSITDSARDITIAKAISGQYALSAGLIWWTLGIVIAIGYFVFVYRMFAGKVRVVAGPVH